jgi:hypothetical protein
MLRSNSAKAPVTMSFSGQRGRVDRLLVQVQIDAAAA